jgi:hypothetical protein
MFNSDRRYPRFFGFDLPRRQSFHQISIKAVPAIWVRISSQAVLFFPRGFDLPVWVPWTQLTWPLLLVMKSKHSIDFIVSKRSSVLKGSDVFRSTSLDPRLPEPYPPLPYPPLGIPDLRRSHPGIYLLRVAIKYRVPASALVVGLSFLNFQRELFYARCPLNAVFHSVLKQFLYPFKPNGYSLLDFAPLSIIRYSHGPASEPLKLNDVP